MPANATGDATCGIDCWPASAAEVLCGAEVVGGVVLAAASAVSTVD